MNAFLTALCLLYWLVCLPEAPAAKVLLAAASFLFLVWRFSLFQKRMLAASILLIPAVTWQPAVKEEPPAGVYEIVQVKKNYAVGQMEGHRILMYSDEDIFWQDRYEVKSFREVHSRNNEGSFSFMDYARKQGIYYQAEERVSKPLQRKDSLPNRILKAIRNHPDSELYEFLFYGWTAKDSAEWIASLGLPVMGFLSLAGSFLRRNGLKVHEWWILCGFIVLYGSLFGWTVSLARAALFRLISSLVQKDALKLPLSIFAFCFLMPHQASSFAFVLPSAAGLMSRFALKPKDAKWASVALCAGLQAVYFSSINPAGLFLFPFLRKLAGWIFLLFSLLFFFPDIWLFEQASRWLNEILTSEVIIWHGMARPVFKLCLLTALILWLLYPVQKKWILAAALLVHPASYALDPFFHVYVLDVGQGDCTLIVEPFQKSAVMIDAAGNLSGTLYKSSIAPFLKSHGIRKLDALIITHDDLDHSGSKDAVLKDYPDCQLIEDLKTPVPVSYPFYSLFQERPESFSEENDQSIVNWFSYDGISYLWMGDATIKVEEQLLEDYDLKADILKAGHHGSATSSSYDFLYETAPSAAVITAGFENRYNHPSASVMDSLEELKIEPLQTSGLGSIHLFSWKGFLFMTTQQKHAGILQTPGKQLG